MAKNTKIKKTSKRRSKQRSKKKIQQRVSRRRRSSKRRVSRRKSQRRSQRRSQRKSRRKSRRKSQRKTQRKTQKKIVIRRSKQTKHLLQKGGAASKKAKTTDLSASPAEMIIKLNEVLDEDHVEGAPGAKEWWESIQEKLKSLNSSLRINVAKLIATSPYESGSREDGAWDDELKRYILEIQTELSRCLGVWAGGHGPD